MKCLLLLYNNVSDNIIRIDIPKYKKQIYLSFIGRVTRDWSKNI